MGEAVPVAASVFRDGHDVLAARALLSRGNEVVSACALTARGNDVWTGTVVPTDLGAHELVVEAWTDRYVLAGDRTSAFTAWVSGADGGARGPGRRLFELFPCSFGGLDVPPARCPG